MTRKFLLFIIFILCVFAFLAFSGCSKAENSGDDIKEETQSEQDKNDSSLNLNPSITHPEGQFLDGNPPRMEGLCVALDKNTITLKVLDEEYKLKLSERTKEEIKIYKDKYNTPVSVGSFLQIPYEKTNDEYTALNILFVQSN